MKRQSQKMNLRAAHIINPKLQSYRLQSM